MAKYEVTLIQRNSNRKRNLKRKERRRQNSRYRAKTVYNYVRKKEISKQKEESILPNVVQTDWKSQCSFKAIFHSMMATDFVCKVKRQSNYKEVRSSAYYLHI